MSGNPWFTLGLILGAGAGATLALLYAPMSGTALVASLRTHIRNAQDEARIAGREAEADILTRYKQMRDASGGIRANQTDQPGRPSLAPRVP
jgi:gas vesicle protein